MQTDRPQDPSELHSAHPTPSTERMNAGHHQRRFTYTLAAFAAVYLFCTYAIVHDLGEPQHRWALAVLPSVVALVAVIAYWRYLRVADELSRLIELHGLAYSVSAGFIAWPTFELLDRAGLAISAGLNVPVLIMVGFYTLGVVLTRRRYW